MITITVEDKAEAPANTNPKGSLSALKSRRTMAEKAGNTDLVADYDSQIRQLLEQHPEIGTKPARPAPTAGSDPRRNLGALRAIRSRWVGKDDAKVAEYDQRIADYIAAHPDVTAPRLKPRAETKDSDGEVNRSAVLAVQERHKDVMTTELDRILRRSAPAAADRKPPATSKKAKAKAKAKPAPAGKRRDLVSGKEIATDPEKQAA